MERNSACTEWSSCPITYTYSYLLSPIQMGRSALPRLCRRSRAHRHIESTVRWAAKGRFGKKSRLTAFCVARRTSVTSSITFSGTPLGQSWCEIPLSIAGCGEIRANWVACPEPTGEDTHPPSNYFY